MSSRTKCQDVQFHSDRILEATTMVVKSIIEDPRVPMEEKIQLLTTLSGVHVGVVEMIHSAIESGCYRAIAEMRQ